MCGLKLADVDLKNSQLTIRRLKGSLKTTQPLTDHQGEPLLSEGITVKTFLLVFLVSTAASICLWQFGLGNKISPAHPFLASVLTAAACGIAIQLLFSRQSASTK